MPVMLHWTYQKYKNIFTIFVFATILCLIVYALIKKVKMEWKSGFTFHLFGVDILALTKLVNREIYREKFFEYFTQFSTAFLGILLGSYWSNYFFPTSFSPPIFVWWAFGCGVYSIKLPKEAA